MRSIAEVCQRTACLPASLWRLGPTALQATGYHHGRRVTCDSHLGVTDDSKLGSLVPTGFFKGNTFRVKNGADSLALGGDTGTWGLGVGLGDNLYEICGQLFRFWGAGTR